MTESNGGTIVTFYSYKGGTGRTMALANVAWILASHGYRVLAVDWDLESPGLHRFFLPLLADPQLRTSDGVIDLIRDFARYPELRWLNRFHLVPPILLAVALYFIGGFELGPYQGAPSRT